MNQFDPIDMNLRKESKASPVIDASSQPQLASMSEGGNAMLQAIGLLPSTAIATSIIDVMLSGLDLATLGAFEVFSFVAAVGLGFYTYHMQTHVAGDNKNVALAKSVLISVVTVLPIPITPIIAVPAGIAGFINNHLKKR